MRKFKQIEHRLPTSWAYFIENGDHSGYSERELEEINAYLKSNTTTPLIYKEDLGFSWRNDANNGGGEVSVFIELFEE